jgi:uncharacterized protein with NRDE domain
VASCRDEYSPFNLIVGEISHGRRELRYYSNRIKAPYALSPGIYGLSNHLLDTPWPKVANGKARLARWLEGNTIDSPAAFEILADETLAVDAELPSTGISYAAEKALSPIFIKTPGYGTRCSTVLFFGVDGEWDLEEKTFV